MMRCPSFQASAERAIHLRAANFGSPCLQIMEENGSGLSPDRIVSIYNAATDMDRLSRAIAAFNAVMTEDTAALSSAELGEAA